MSLQIVTRKWDWNRWRRMDVIFLTATRTGLKRPTGYDMTHAQADAECIRWARERTQTWTCARQQTHRHRHNYLSNARCDFLGVNELINILKEGRRGWLEVKICLCPCCIILLRQVANGKMENCTLGDAKHQEQKKDGWHAWDQSSKYCLLSSKCLQSACSNLHYLLQRSWCSLTGARRSLL